MHQHTYSRRHLAALTALAAGLALASALPAQAQAPATHWPTKPVKLVVGYAAGGATDVVARLIAVKLGEQLGQPVMVDNRAGANSNLGAELVAKAPADGYTLYVFTIANTINASLYSKLGYDPQKDFEPIGMIAKIPNILVVNNNLPIKNLADYVRYAKESKDGITFASSGSGSSIHLSDEMFKMNSKLNMLHVPYKGSAQSGFPGFDVQSWFALAAPAGTPKPIIDQTNAALNKVLAQPDVRQRLQDLAATPAPGTPEQMSSFAGAEIKRWHDVVKASGAKAE